MRYYPVNLDISGMECVVFGGGRVAERKVIRLLECGADVVVVAPEVTEGLAELAAAGRIEHLKSKWDDGRIEEAFLVIAATADEKFNEVISDECEDADVMCNIVDDPERCSFTLPALVARGDLCLAISTGGKSPALAKRVRLELEKIYGEEYAEFVDLLGKIRDRVMAQEGGDEAERAAKFERLAGSELPQLIKAKDTAAIDALLAEVLGEGFSLEELAKVEPPKEGLDEEESEDEDEEDEDE